MRGRRRAPRAWNSTKPAAKVRPAPRNCSGATAAAGASSVERRMATNDNHHVIAVSDPAALAKAAAERVLARIAANGDRVAICLTGGSSPKQLYQLLATEAFRSQIPWDRVHWFIGAERFLPAD